jgi:hypothetical protein
MDSSGSRHCQVAGFCDYGNEHFCSTKGCEFLDQTNNHKLLKREGDVTA